MKTRRAARGVFCLALSAFCVVQFSLMNTAKVVLASPNTARPLTASSTPAHDIQALRQAMVKTGYSAAEIDHALSQLSDAELQALLMNPEVLLRVGYTEEGEQDYSGVVLGLLLVLGLLGTVTSAAENKNTSSSRPSSNYTPPPRVVTETKVVKEVWETCPTCNGDGKAVCDRCNGTGKEAVKNDWGKYDDCQKCGGSGNLNRDCPTCNGKGQIKKY